MYRLLVVILIVAVPSFSAPADGNLPQNCDDEELAKMLTRTNCGPNQPTEISTTNPETTTESTMESTTGTTVITDSPYGSNKSNDSSSLNVDIKSVEDIKAGSIETKSHKSHHEATSSNSVKKRSKTVKSDVVKIINTKTVELNEVVYGSESRESIESTDEVNYEAAIEGYVEKIDTHTTNKDEITSDASTTIEKNNEKTKENLDVTAAPGDKVDVDDTTINEGTMSNTSEVEQDKTVIEKDGIIDEELKTYEEQIDGAKTVEKRNDFETKEVENKDDVTETVRDTTKDENEERRVGEEERNNDVHNNIDKTDHTVDEIVEIVDDTEETGTLEETTEAVDETVETEDETTDATSCMSEDQFDKDTSNEGEESCNCAAEEIDLRPSQTLRKKHKPPCPHYYVPVYVLHKVPCSCSKKDGTCPRHQH